MSLDPGWKDSMKEVYRNNRYEVLFDDVANMTEAVANTLRLSCHSAKLQGDTLKLLFYDFEGNSEYNSVRYLVRQNLSSHIRLSIVCFNGKHEVYETLEITGIPETIPQVNFDWSDSNSFRNLEITLTNIEVISKR
jgi:hypothetical protein